MHVGEKHAVVLSEASFFFTLGSVGGSGYFGDGASTYICLLHASIGLAAAAVVVLQSGCFCVVPRP